MIHDDPSVLRHQTVVLSLFRLIPPMTNHCQSSIMDGSCFSHALPFHDFMHIHISCHNFIQQLSAFGIKIIFSNFRVLSYKNLVK